MKKIIIFLALIYWTNNTKAEVIVDKTRQRSIPIAITLPIQSKHCTSEHKCSVALVSAGYGVSHLKYRFITDKLNELGYLAIAIAHELPNDPPLSTTGNLFQTRSENWRRGAETLDFIKTNLAKRFTHYDFENLMLVGHSNGGDISAWLANNDKTYIKKLITLDHRRVPLSRTNNIQVLSIRASDFPADQGVLPSKTEQQAFNSCIIKIPDAKHNDIADYGPAWLKEKIRDILTQYLNNKPCSLLNAQHLS